MQPPECQQLSKQKGNSRTWSILEDARRLEELEVKNDDVVALCYSLDGTSYLLSL